MPRAFAQIAYTPSVQAAQTRYGSREANAGFDLDPKARNTVSERELEFLPMVDTFFMATVGENGWPYVQHRGGPKGFLKILDEHTLGFADFAGNRQYISVGNISHDNRITLILIDFATRRRLKIWGRARIVHETDEPDLIARLEVPSYRARIERGYIITIEALDFNCSQHIAQRFTEAEIAERFFSEQQEIRMLRQQMNLEASAALLPPPAVLGSGELELVITGIRQLTPRVRAYELRRPDGTDLPLVTAGSHLAVPVRLQDGSADTRHYSIASNPARRNAYEIAVLKEETSRGGSAAIHRDYSLGMVLRCGMPKNTFALHEDDRPAVLIAGGIGITPIKAMAQALQGRNNDYFLHYAARSAEEMPYRSRLAVALAGHAAFYFSAEHPDVRLDLARVFDQAPANAVFYACGPSKLIDAFRRIAQERGIEAERIRYERFTSAAALAADRPITVQLKRSNKTIEVPGNQTILDALIYAGAAPPFECRAGNCGACATKVIDGIPDHRDAALTQPERDSAALMCICISRAKSERLVLDL